MHLSTDDWKVDYSDQNEVLPAFFTDIGKPGGSKRPLDMLLSPST